MWCFSLWLLLVWLKVMYHIIPVVFSAMVGEVLDLREQRRRCWLCHSFTDSLLKAADHCDKKIQTCARCLWQHFPWSSPTLWSLFGSRVSDCRSKSLKGVLPGAEITCTFARNHCLNSSCDTNRRPTCFCLSHWIYHLQQCTAVIFKLMKAPTVVLSSRVCAFFREVCVQVPLTAHSGSQ